MNTAAIITGRLVEVRVDPGYANAQEVDALFDRIEAEKAAHPEHRQFLTAVDWRRCVVLSDDASSRMLERIRRTNADVVRSAALARHDSPSTVGQFLRLILGSHHPMRKLFFDPQEMCDWLRPVMASNEEDRLKRFLRL